MFRGIVFVFEALLSRFTSVEKLVVAPFYANFEEIWHGLTD
jgi:hypothetical protein